MTITVIRTQPITPPVEKVVVEMSAAEAGVILAVVGRIAGPDQGPRGVTDALYHALKDAGVEKTPIMMRNNDSLWPSSVWIEY